MTRAYRQTRSCICKIVLRILGILAAIAAVILPIVFNKGAYIWPYLFVAGVSALWSLIDFILLCIRHDAHPVAGIIIDLLFLLATGAVGILAAVSVSTSSSSYPMVLTMEFPLLLLTAILHFVFFVRAIVAYRRKRRNRKAGYRPDSYSMHNGTAENLIPMENRRVLNGHSEF